LGRKDGDARRTGQHHPGLLCANSRAAAREEVARTYELRRTATATGPPPARVMASVVLRATLASAACCMQGDRVVGGTHRNYSRIASSQPHGVKTRMPVSAKSFVLRVPRGRSYCLQMAAI